MFKNIFFFFFAISVFAQKEYPTDFISPLDIPLDLSGSFGELRSNHFHAGLDLKTNGVEGLKVYAVADGYVSRIKISTFGYGKAIYVTHPNGYTTVYGHLQSANGAIEEYIKKKHYENKNYEIELFLKSSELPVKQGDIIALTGNSGGSGGPHLHFEYRDSKTENIVHPMHFGLKSFIKDNNKPFLQGVMAYPIDSVIVNSSQKPVAISFTKQSEGVYLASKVKTNGKVGFAINAYDYCTNMYNKNGLYKVNAYLNGVLYFQYDFETFSFSESRGINNFIDYKRFKDMKQRFQKLFYTTPYNLSVIKNQKNMGIINAQPNSNYTYRIELYDFHNNKTEVIIPIEYENNPTANIPYKEAVTPYYVKAKNEYNYTKENVSIYIPENTFYDNFYLDFDVKDQILSFKEQDIALAKNITISYTDVQGLSEEEMAKTFIATVSGNKLDYNSTKRKGNTFTLYTKYLDTYKLAQDNDAPRIYNVNFVEGRNLDNQKTLSVSIADNLSGIDTYNGYLNGEWILMEYDYKTKKLIHDLSEKKYKAGRNDLKIIVTDNMQNSTTFETHFLMSN